MFTPITITMTDTRADQTPAQGTITATLSETIQNSGTVIDPSPVVGTLNTQGQLKNSSGQPFILVANDDPGTLPAGTVYRFVLQLDGAPVDQFEAIIPHTAAAGTIDLSTLRPTL